MPREVGVEDLDGLEDVNVDRRVGVAGLDPPPGVTGLEPGPPEEGGLDPGPPDEEGLRIPETEEVNPVDEVGCLGIRLLLSVVSVWEFANYITTEKGNLLAQCRITRLRKNLVHKLPT